MLENIFETVIKGSNTIFLNVPEQDYFFNYKDLNIEAAQEITGDYFEMKKKDGIPSAKEIDLDTMTHRVKIIVDVDKNTKQELDQFPILAALSLEKYK